MNKRALETDVLVTTIIVLVSLLILAFAIGKITGIIPETVTKETCHASVLARGFEAKGIPVGKLVSTIKCKTEYKCITMGGVCPKGYEQVSVSNEENIKAELAADMYDCWWQLGEGKVKFWSDSTLKEFGFGKALSTCSICSVVAFDDKILAKNYKLDMASYMASTKVPSKSITYLQYFTNGIENKLPVAMDIPTLSTDKSYAILFTGMGGQELLGPIKNDVYMIAGAGAASLYFGGIGATAKAAQIGLGSLFTKAGGLEVTTAGGDLITTLGGKTVLTTAGWIALATAAVVGTTQVATAASNQRIVATYCNGDVNGCAQVAVFPWDPQIISGKCGRIESIP